MPSPESHDVAIVGAGLAGLTAGARLAERGVRVVVLEKGGDERYPCNVRISGGVFHICFRHVDDDAGALLETIKRNTRGFARDDQAAVTAKHARAAVRWYKDKGARFAPGGAEAWRENTLAAPAAEPGQRWQGHGGGELLRILTGVLKSGGGTLMLGATRQTAAHGRKPLRRTRRGAARQDRDRDRAQRDPVRRRIPGERGARARVHRAAPGEAQAAQLRVGSRRRAQHGAGSGRATRRHGQVLRPRARARGHAERHAVALSHGRSDLFRGRGRRSLRPPLRRRGPGRSLDDERHRAPARSAVRCRRVR